MSGNYPDVPSWRMAIDRDGTQGYTVSAANIVAQLTGADLVKLNNEADDYVSFADSNAVGSRIVLIFPELRDIDGFYVEPIAASSGGPTVVIEVSADSTNGLDGTWTNVATVGSPGESVIPNYRTQIVATTQLAMRAIRARMSNANSSTVHRLSAFHVFGEPAPGENPHRLALWHPTLDQRITPAYFDWGNTPRSSSADRLFRVKNLSPSLTAGSTRVAMEALTDGSPSVPGQHSLSFGGGSFLAQVNVGDLAPGAISGQVTLRRITPSNAQLGLFAMRVFAESTAWS